MTCQKKKKIKNLSYQISQAHFSSIQITFDYNDDDDAAYFFNVIKSKNLPSTEREISNAHANNLNVN